MSAKCFFLFSVLGQEWVLNELQVECLSVIVVVVVAVALHLKCGLCDCVAAAIISTKCWGNSYRQHREREGEEERGRAREMTSERLSIKQEFYREYSALPSWSTPYITLPIRLIERAKLTDRYFVSFFLHNCFVSHIYRISTSGLPLLCLIYHIYTCIYAFRSLLFAYQRVKIKIKKKKTYVRVCV